MNRGGLLLRCRCGWLVQDRTAAPVWLARPCRGADGGVGRRLVWSAIGSHGGGTVDGPGSFLWMLPGPIIAVAVCKRAIVLLSGLRRQLAAPLWLTFQGTRCWTGAGWVCVLCEIQAGGWGCRYPVPYGGFSCLGCGQSQVDSGFPGRPRLSLIRQVSNAASS